jgi:hypothetical protein
MSEYNLTDTDCENLLQAIRAPKGTRFGRRVPKCKKCDSYSSVPTGKITYHQCNHLECYKHAGYNGSRIITYREVRTSPKWCPKRCENLPIGDD